MQHEIHGAESSSALNQLPSLEGLLLESLLFFFGHIGIAPYDIVMRSQKEATSTTGRVTDSFTWGRVYHINHGADQWAGCKILTSSCFCILSVFFQKTFISIAFDICAHYRPVFIVNQINNKPPQFGRVLKFVLGLHKNQPKQALFFSQLS